MNFVLKPTLEHIARVKIATTLWNHYKVLIENSNFIDIDIFLSSRPGNVGIEMWWKHVEINIMEKVRHLPVPELLKEKILCFIKPVGLQILKWIECHCLGDYLRVDLPATFCWTPTGTIDRKRTAEVLIKDEKLDIVTRFKLACIYCLEDDIPVLWRTIPCNLRKSFSYDDDSLTYFHLPREASQQDLVFFWIHRIKQQMCYLSYFSASTVNSVECCALGGNKVATEYFLKNLIRFGTDEPLITITKRATTAEVVSFLLPQMDQEQRMEVFKSQPYEILQFFLDWPLQSFFIKVADDVWDFLSVENFTDLLCTILIKAERGFKDWNYQNLFKKFWQKSPSTHKSYAAVASNSFLLRELLEMRDKENVKLILQVVPITEKKRLLYSYRGMSCCDDLISENEWSFLGFFIRECLSTHDEMIKFKLKFEISFRYNLLENNKHKWDKLFCLSDDSVCNIRNKRGCSEDESYSVKRFHSTQ